MSGATLVRAFLACALTGTFACANLARAAVVVEPSWLRYPTQEQILGLWPSRALGAGIGGTARIRCHVSRGGALRGCQIVHESPSGYGFGDAALAMAAQFAMRPQTVDGRATDDGVVTLPISFGPLAGGMASDQVTVLTNPPWIAAPTLRDIAAVLPAASRRGVDGRVVLQCSVTAKGTLGDCRTGQAIPRWQGFPQTETSHGYFWGMARQFAVHDTELTEKIRAGQHTIFSEDLEMLEQQQKNLLRHPQRKLLKLNNDAGGVRSRMMIERAIAAEADPESVDTRAA